MHIHLHVVNEHAPSRPENLRYGTMPDPIDWGCEKCGLVLRCRSSRNCDRWSNGWMEHWPYATAISIADRRMRGREEEQSRSPAQASQKGAAAQAAGQRLGQELRS